VLMNY